MKVFFDHQIFQIQKYGGISRYVLELAKSLNAISRHQFKIITWFYINQYLFNERHEVYISGIYIKNINVFCRKLNSFFEKIVVFFLRPDIVHWTYYFNERSRFTSTRIVLTVYDMIHEVFPSHFKEGDLTSKRKRNAVDNADHIICISEQTKKDLIKYFAVKEEKISVVYLGFSFQVSNLTATFEYKRPFLLYVGNRENYKNFQGLFDAYVKSKYLHSEYDLICFGGGEFNSKEQDMIAKNNLVEHVLHVSGGDEILQACYKSASIFVYPSIYEGFGIPPLEAMSCGCPVVCSNTSSIPEVVGEAALMFNPHNTHDILKTIETVVKDETLRQKLISLGKKRINAFSWEKCAAQTLSVYKKVLE